MYKNKVFIRALLASDIGAAPGSNIEYITYESYAELRAKMELDQNSLAIIDMGIWSADCSHDRCFCDSKESFIMVLDHGFERWESTGNLGFASAVLKRPVSVPELNFYVQRFFHHQKSLQSRHSRLQEYVDQVRDVRHSLAQPLTVTINIIDHICAHFEREGQMPHNITKQLQLLKHSNHQIGKSMSDFRQIPSLFTLHKPR